jgi:pyruvate dehydrogenase E2 component (dihydrolipoamide acetyltransferase)
MREVRMPQIALGDEEMTIVAWLKQPGELVEEGQPLLEVETEKASMDVEAPFTGTLDRQLCAPGELVSAGQVIAMLAPAADEPAGAVLDPPAAAATGTAVADGRRPAAARAAPPRLAPRAALVEHGELRGAFASTVVPTPGVAAVSVPGGTGHEPLSRRRLATARRLTEATAIPQFSITRRVAIDGAVAAVAAARAGGVAATLTDAFVVALARAAAAVPRANAWLVGDALELFGRVALALAVDTPEGVLAPVIDDAGALDVAAAAALRADLVARARAARLALRELEGATITLSNVGGIGGDSVVPVLTPPQVAIVGVGRGQVDGERTFATFTFVGDHRALDGADGARFLVAVEQELHALGP